MLHQVYLIITMGDPITNPFTWDITLLINSLAKHVSSTFIDSYGTTAIHVPCIANFISALFMCAIVHAWQVPNKSALIPIPFIYRRDVCFLPLMFILNETVFGVSIYLFVLNILCTEQHCFVFVCACLGNPLFEKDNVWSLAHKMDVVEANIDFPAKEPHQQIDCNYAKYRQSGMPGH